MGWCRVQPASARVLDGADHVLFRCFKCVHVKHLTCQVFDRVKLVRFQHSLEAGHLGFYLPVCLGQGSILLGMLLKQKG